MNAMLKPQTAVAIDNLLKKQPTFFIKLLMINGKSITTLKGVEK